MDESQQQHAATAAAAAGAMLQQPSCDSHHVEMLMLVMLGHSTISAMQTAAVRVSSSRLTGG